MAAITETLVALDQAVRATTPPKGVSPGMVEQVQWNLHRLLAGSEIGERGFDANDVKGVNVK